MKAKDLFCTSEASTAICSSIDHQQHHSLLHHGNSISNSRAIDRHNPHLRDPRRSRLTTIKPSSSTPSTSTASSFSSSSSSSSATPSSSLTIIEHPSKPPKPTKQKGYKNHKKKNNKNKSTYNSSDDPFINSPTGSSRYLLSDSVFLDVFSEFDPDSALVSIDPHDFDSALVSIDSHHDDFPSPKPSTSSPSSSTASHDQVVVLRVSLHCKGCERKVRKHISKMQGVRSFSIDFPTKKVTITGDVTPVGVLSSVSRVKNAQFWPSSSASSDNSLAH